MYIFVSSNQAIHLENMFQSNFYWKKKLHISRIFHCLLTECHQIQRTVSGSPLLGYGILKIGSNPPVPTLFNLLIKKMKELPCHRKRRTSILILMSKIAFLLP